LTLLIRFFFAAETARADLASATFSHYSLQHICFKIPIRINMAATVRKTELVNALWWNILDCSNADLLKKYLSTSHFHLRNKSKRGFYFS